jgi:methylglutaconyl-CoA hydratase
MFKTLASFAAPVVAAVQGAAIAGATGLIACCDHVIATEDACFSLPEVRLGIVAATIAPYIVRKLGTGHAASLMLSGRRILAAEAKQLGLVHELSPSSNQSSLNETVCARLAEFLKCSPEALRRTKALLFCLTPLPTDATIEYTAQHLANARDSSDAREGLTAFFEKRNPSWFSDLLVKS